MSDSYSMKKEKNTMNDHKSIDLIEINNLIYDLENEFRVGGNSQTALSKKKISTQVISEYANIPSKDMLIKSLVAVVKEIRYSKLEKYFYDLKNQFDILSKILELKDNWNDNGAKKFSDKLIMKCYRVLVRLSVLPEIFPVADGSIQFEYEKKDGSYLEFDIFENEVSEFIIYPNGKEIERTIEEDKIAEEVKIFYEKSNE